jgi:hypothetical protein
MVEETVKAYTAGIVDADGSIGIYLIKNQGYYPKVTVTMAESGGIDLIQTSFEGSIRQLRPNTSGGRPMIILTYPYVRAYNLLQAILPYMRVRHEQAKLVVEFWETARGFKGQKTSPERRARQEELARRVSMLNRPGQLQRLSEGALEESSSEATVRTLWEHSEVDRNDQPPTERSE